MRYYILISFVFLFSLDSNSQEDKEDSSDFNYSLISVDLIQTDETAVGAKLSLPLPGGLYVVLERRAEGVDTSNDSYDRVINAARIGVHAGIGDLFSSISSKGFKLSVKNVFDVYAELGLKSTAYDSDINSFSEDDSQANVVTGIRFGNSSGWEGKLFLDFSKDAGLKIKQCPSGQMGIV